MTQPNHSTRYPTIERAIINLTREDVPADAMTALSAWIEEEHLLVDEREDMGGITFFRTDAKDIAPLPHIFVALYARRPYKRKTGHYPNWNFFCLLLYRDVEEGWKLMQVKRHTSPAQFVLPVIARGKAEEEVKRLLGNDMSDSKG